jgi:hypothetical protein
MSQPNYLDKALSNVSNAWLNADDDFIAGEIFPSVFVKQKTFKVPKYGKEGLIVPSSLARTGEAPAKRVDYSRTYDTPTVLTEKALSDVVTKDDYDQTDDPFNAESDAVEFIKSRKMLFDEKNLATILTDTAVVTQNQTLSGTDQWSDYGNSDPIDDIKTAMRAIRGSAFKLPNSMWFDWQTWLVLQDHPAVVDRLRGAAIIEVTQAMLLRLLAPYGIERILVGKAQENTGGEGLADATSPIWGKHALLGYINQTPGLKQVNGGYKFTLENGSYVTREEKVNPEITELVDVDYYEHILLNDTCYYLFKNAIA